MFWSSIIKEMKIFLSDKSNVTVQLLMPLILIVFIVFALGGVGEVQKEEKFQMPVYFTSTAKEENVRLIKTFLDNNDVFQIEEYSSKDELLSNVEKGRRIVALVLVDNTIEVYENTASTSAKGIIGALQNGLRQTYFALNGISIPVLPEPEYKFASKTIGEQEEYPSAAAQFVPSYAIMFMFFLIMNMGKVLIQEDENGTMKRLIAAPISTTALLISKLIPYFLLGLLQATLFFGVGGLIVDLPVGEHIVELVVISIAVVLVVITAGLFIASVSKTEKQLNGYGTLFALLGAGIGGLMVPLYVMPDTMQKVAQIVPQNWALVAFQDVFVRNKGIIEIMPKIGVLLSFAVVFFALGLVTFRKRFFY